MPSLAYQTVDAFTPSPFSGNPAAVFRLSQEETKQIDTAQMQLIAREFNLSETAFVCAQGDDDGKVVDGEVNYLIRWFTPNVEVPLCGHATLASSHSIFTTHNPDAIQINFSSLYSGILTSKRKPKDRIELNFPADVTSHSRTIEKGSDRWYLIAQALNKALDQDVEQYLVAMCDSSTGTLIEFTADGINLEKAKWDPSALTVDVSTFLTIVTQPAKEGTHDVSSRVFGPLLGVPEDPVTGAAHTVLGPYWGKTSTGPHARLLEAKGVSAWSKDSIECKQVSERGGLITVRWDENDPERISLEGAARTMMRGTLEW